MKIACVCLVILLGASARGDVVTLLPSRDATLYQSASGDLANGAGSGFFAGTNGTGLVRRGLIAFDLAPIPAGATITGATLRLTMTQSSSGSLAHSLHRALAPWGESTSVAPGNGGGGPPSPPTPPGFTAPSPPSSGPRPAVTLARPRQRQHRRQRRWRVRVVLADPGR